LNGTANPTAENGFAAIVLPQQINGRFGDVADGAELNAIDRVRTVNIFSVVILLVRMNHTGL
jgi:hypothetical protein